MKVFGLDLQSQRVTNMSDPSTGTDAATKQYVDNVAAGLQWKAPVRAATTANGALATAYANGQSIDGVALVTGNRILLKNQTAGAENGIYIVPASGAPSRSSDADTGSELAPGTTVTVTEGTVNADKAYMIISDTAIVIGTTSQTWGSFSAGSTYTGSNGILLTGNNFTAVAAPGGGLTVGAGGISIDTTVVARKASGNLGNGSLTSIPFAHNLGTKDIEVSVRESTGDAFVLVDWVATDTNTVTFTFPSAPAAAQYRATVVG